MGQAPWLVLMLMVLTCPEGNLIIQRSCLCQCDFCTSIVHTIMCTCGSTSCSPCVHCGFKWSLFSPTPHSNSYCIFKTFFWIWNTLLNLCFIVEVMKLLFDFCLKICLVIHQVTHFVCLSLMYLFDIRFLKVMHIYRFTCYFLNHFLKFHVYIKNKLKRTQKEIFYFLLVHF